MATIAYYGPDLKCASKVAVGIIPFEGADTLDLRSWTSDKLDVRDISIIGKEILEFIERHGAKSVVVTESIIGCPHQEGIDYEGEWCPVCDFWNGRDRFTGELLC